MARGENVLVDRISDQRDHWRDMAKLYKAKMEVAEGVIAGIDKRMGPGWTQRLKDVLTAGDAAGDAPR